MLGGVIGRLASGAVWGLGAAAALSLAGSGTADLRPVAKRVLKVCVVAADRVQEIAAEARESLEDLYAEVRFEQEQAARNSVAPADAPAPDQPVRLELDYREKRDGAGQRSRAHR